MHYELCIKKMCIMNYELCIKIVNLHDKKSRDILNMSDNVNKY